MSTVKEIRARLQEMMWLTDDCLRPAVRELYEDLGEDDSNESEDDSGEEDAPPVVHPYRDPSPPTRMDMVVREDRETIDELRLQLASETRAVEFAAMRIANLEQDCTSLQHEVKAAEKAAVDARAETFSTLIEREVALVLRPGMGEDETERVAELLAEKKRLLSTRRSVEEAVAALPREEFLNTVQLVIGGGHQRAWDFPVPYKLAILHLRTVTVAWLKRLEEQYRETMGVSQ